MRPHTGMLNEEAQYESDTSNIRFSLYIPTGKYYDSYNVQKHRSKLIIYVAIKLIDTSLLSSVHT